MGSALCLTEVNIVPKFYETLSVVQEIWSGHEIQGSNSRPLILTVTLAPHGWGMGTAHRLYGKNIWFKFKKILSGIKEILSGHEMQDSNSWSSIVILTLSPHVSVMGSGHRLIEVNILSKVNENGSGEIKGQEL